MTLKGEICSSYIHFVDLKINIYPLILEEYNLYMPHEISSTLVPHHCTYHHCTYPTLLISYVYTILDTIYCILPSLCNTCISSHLYMFTYPTLLISYVYTVLYTVYCILPMPFCTIIHSYIVMYIFFIPLHLCV
jgi:hypothetical protein